MLNNRNLCYVISGLKFVFNTGQFKNIISDSKNKFNKRLRQILSNLYKALSNESVEFDGEKRGIEYFKLLDYIEKNAPWDITNNDKKEEYKDIDRKTYIKNLADNSTQEDSRLFVDFLLGCP